MKQKIITSFLKLGVGYTSMLGGYLAQSSEQPYLSLVLFTVALFFFISSWVK